MTISSALTDPQIRSNHRSLAVLAIMLLFSPCVIYGAIGALKSTSNDPRQWLPSNFAETDKHLWFEEHFGIDEIAVVSWPGCTLDDPRVEQLASVLDPSPMFRAILTGPRLLNRLSAPPLEISDASAIKRLRGIMVGADGKTTCVLFEISSAGQRDRTATISLIVETAAKECKLAPRQLKMGGPTVDAAAIDQESRRLLLQLAGLSAAVSLLVAALRLRNLRLAMILLFGAAYSTGLSLSVLYFSGGRMNLLMTMLPPLVYVLTISSGVHLLNYYRDAVEEGGVRDAERRAIADGWLPCVLAAATTAVGLISLATSKIVPIQEFGVYAAIGMLVSVATLLIYLPAVLRVHATYSRRHHVRPDMERHVARADTPQRMLSGYLMKIIRWHTCVIAICLLLMGFCGFGLTLVDSTVKLQHRFVSKSKMIQDYLWLEEHLGPLVPLEVILSLPQGAELALVDRMELLGKVERRIRELDDVGATMSALTFAPKPPRGNGIRRVVQRTLYSRRLDKSRQAFKDAHLLAEDSEQHWRISVRARALGNLDYGQFTETLQRAVEPVLRERAAIDVKATYTGIIPLIYKAQRQLLHDLMWSFLTAFAVIALIMMVILRSAAAGLTAMVVNVFPAIVVFGCMGWMGILLQIGSVMTASAALGIAVDDTVHFLTWFRRGLKHQPSRAAALRESLSRCADAMFLTTLICGAGLSVFGLSSFVPILHFAWLMVALLVAALIGDLVFLPAILIGPLGRMFQPKHETDEVTLPETARRPSQAAQ